MPSTVTVITAFVASPSDLAEERRILAEEIQHLNRAWARTTRIRLDLIGWESHTFPGVGQYPQAVINQQIGDSYDIFIGLMGTRFGTPTPEYGSGTEEEFERAYQRWQADRASTQIMIYFKETAVNPLTLDVAQLQKVLAFKERIAAAGVYSFTFADRNQFVDLLRLHLARVVQDWITPQKPIIVHNNAVESTSPGEPDTLGFLDHLEVATESVRTALGATARVAEALEDINVAITKRTAQIESLTKSGSGFDPSSAKKVMLLTSQDMTQFAGRLEAEIPIFANAYKSAIEQMTALANLSVEEFSTDAGELRQLRDVISAHEPQMEAAIKSLSAMKVSVEGIPRLAETLIKAKRRTAKALDNFLYELNFACKLNKEGVVLLDTLIDKLIARQKS